ncbi:MAG: hypothetical protein GY906_24795 [bacterium]|nr:hypothetical protein [bacterium]
MANGTKPYNPLEAGLAGFSLGTIPFAAEKLKNLTTGLGGGVGGVLRSPGLIGAAERIQPGLGGAVYGAGTEMEEWAKEREAAERIRQEGAEESLRQAMGGAYQPPSAAPVDSAPAQPPPETGGPPTEMIQGGEMRLTPEEQREADFAAWGQQTQEAQYSPSENIADLRQRAGLQMGTHTPEAQLPQRRSAGGTRSKGGFEVGPRVGGLGAAESRAKDRGQGGAFSASRQLPPDQASWDYVSRTESPAIQDLWLENKRKSLGIRTAEDQLRLEGARADLMESQAEESGLPFEAKLNRQYESAMNMHTRIKERVMPDVQKQVDEYMTTLSTDPEGMKLLAKPGMKKRIEAQKMQEFQNASMTNLLNMVMMSMMASDPAGAARFQQAMVTSGMGGYGATPAGITPQS